MSVVQHDHRLIREFHWIKTFMFYANRYWHTLKITTFKKAVNT